MADDSRIDELNKLLNNPYTSGADSTASDTAPDDKIVISSQTSYWVQSRQPLASLFFVLPFLLIYEIGVLLQGADKPRNGAEVWLREGLAAVKLGRYYFLLPLLIVVILLAWHHVTCHRWKITKGLLTGMLIESSVLALVLIMIARMQSTWFPFSIDANSGDVISLLSIGDSLQRLVSYFGAGVYEEMLFRLIMLPAVAWIFTQSGMKGQVPWLVAAVITSLLFSAAHHVGSHGEVFAIRPFVFRAVAGMFFCLLFLYRGFGIGVGTHAIYDILVGLI